MATFLILAADFYPDIAEELILGAKSHLQVEGHSADIIRVPGAFELPAALHFALHSQERYAGYIALGCVVRGETPHFDYVCAECARGLQDLALKHKIALGFGVLTTDTPEQAKKRASVNGGNKGRTAAETCLQMMALRERFGLNDA